MIKTGEIKAGVTPDEKADKTKTASQQKPALEDHLSKRAADIAANTLKTK